MHERIQLKVDKQKSKESKKECLKCQFISFKKNVDIHMSICCKNEGKRQGYLFIEESNEKIVSFTDIFDNSNCILGFYLSSFLLYLFQNIMCFFTTRDLNSDWLSYISWFLDYVSKFTDRFHLIFYLSLYYMTLWSEPSFHKLFPEWL